MPGLDGAQTLRMFRERGVGVPVVLMTGDPTHKNVAVAKELGVARVLRKPFRLLAIAQAVKDLLAEPTTC